MGIDIAIACAKAVVILLIALQVMGMGVFFERKVSALIQDRIGANRAAIFGFAGHGLINTLVADPVKFLPRKTSSRPAPTACCTRSRPCIGGHPGARRLRRDAVRRRARDRRPHDQPAGRRRSTSASSTSSPWRRSASTASCSAGWASNNRWSLLGGIRGSAQMISYEIAMGLALVGVVLTYGTLDLQEMARRQGELIWGWLPAWGILYQPLAFLSSSSPASPRVEAHPVRSAGERVRAGERLLHRVLGREAPDVHDVRLRRGGAGGGARHDALLRRLAGAVPRRATASTSRGAPPSRCRRSSWPCSRSSSFSLKLVFFTLAPDRDPLDAAALPLRPAHAPRLEGPAAARRSLNVVVTGCARARSAGAAS